MTFEERIANTVKEKLNDGTVEKIIAGRNEKGDPERCIKGLWLERRNPECHR